MICFMYNNKKLNSYDFLYKSRMTSCFGGFGTDLSLLRLHVCKFRQGRNTIDVQSTGRLTYTLPEGRGFRSDNADVVIKDLATMLTSGRLNSYHRSVIKQAYLEANNHIKGLQIAQRLMILSPEFHQTGNVKEITQKRALISPGNKVCKEYKTVIHILLKGGCDSFNMLVPHSQCRDGKGE